MNATAPRAALGDDGERKVRRGRWYSEHLRDREIEFLDDIAARMKAYGPRTFVTQRQRAWIDDIDRKLTRAGVPAEPGEDDDLTARPLTETIGDEVLR